MAQDPAEKLLLQLWAEKKQGKKCRKDFFNGLRNFIGIGKPMHALKIMYVLKACQIVSIIFQLPSSLNSQLEKHFMLLLGLAHSPSFQTYPVTNLYLWAYVGISATRVIFPSTVKASFHVFWKLTCTTLLTFQ